LVADDSEAERRFARDALEAAGHEVCEATDGQQALESFARERPDLVLLDVVMPRLTGLEACRLIKAKTHHAYLPVIMLSTRNSVNARVEGLRSGADDYLGKPYDADELRARVDALLRTRQTLGERGARRGERPAHPTGAEAEEQMRRRIEEEFDRAERYSDPLACLRVACDDRRLREADAAGELLASRLRDVVEGSIRKIDLLHRDDTASYLLFLPNTHFPGALAVAERIWRDARRVGTQEGGDVTVSIGVSFFPNRDTRSLRDLLALVDAALERARADGGGRICLFQHQGYLYTPELAERAVPP
jgi:diguanylate cyclase (GGDEF)-like protein